MDDGTRKSVDKTLDAYRVFERQARTSARQALYFLGFIYRTDREPATEAVRGYAEHAFDQARHLLLGPKALGVSVSPITDTSRGEGEAGDPEIAKANEALSRVERNLTLWQRALEPLLGDFLIPFDEATFKGGKEGAGQGAEPDRDEPFRIARDVRHLLGLFLEATRPANGGWNTFQYRVLTLFRVLHKNLSLAVGLALVYFILFRVEAVHSLWANERWVAIFIAVAVAAPLIITQARRIGLHRRCVREGCDQLGHQRTETVPWWDVGGRPFRSARPIAVEPPSTLRRWPRALTDKRTARGPGGAWNAAREVVADGVGVLRRPNSILALLTGGQASRIAIYFVLWLLVVCGSIFLFGGTRATVFVVFSLCYWILVLTHLVDFWEFLDPFPARLMTLGAVGLLGALRLFGAPLWLFAVVFAVAATGYLLWFLRDPGRPFRLVLCVVMVGCALWSGAVTWTDEATRWREAESGGVPIDRLRGDEWPAPGDGPVVVMAASGGGSRSALFTGMTLACLWDEHPDLVSGLQAISSVSGGSLANAAYLARAAKEGPIVEKLLGPLAGDSPCRRAGPIDTPSLLESPFLQALGGDFLRPTLRGLLIPTLGRGEAIESRWTGEEARSWSARLLDHLDRLAARLPWREGRTEPVALGDLTLGRLADLWRTRAADGPPFPVPLFNSTTLEGHRMVLSPLAAEAYTRADQRREALHPQRNRYVETYGDSCGERPTRVFYRDAIYGLEDVLPTYDPLLASAVRASANFPFGFPLVKIEPSAEGYRYLEPAKVFDRATKWYLQPLNWLPGGDLVQLTDGGALSNSGLWTLHNLLLPDPPTAVHDCAAWPGRTGGAGDSRGPAASSSVATNEAPGEPSDAVDEPLHCELLRRGVLLIVVEASKMPTFPQIKRSDLALAGAIKDQSPIGQYLHRTMFDLLEASYPGRIAIEQIDLVPTEEGNVLTTWALSEATREELRDSFLAQWPGFSRRVGAAWEALASRTPPESDWGARPPAD